MSADTAGRIAAFLDAHHVLSLATCGADGPHAANLFYARDGLALVWMSDPASRHSADLERDARAAATIAPDCFEIGDIRGIQMTGRARAILAASDRLRAQQLMQARFPYVGRLSRAPALLREAYARMAFYRLEPRRVVLIDNSRGFGHKDVIELPPPAQGSSRDLPLSFDAA